MGNYELGAASCCGGQQYIVHTGQTGAPFYDVAGDETDQLILGWVAMGKGSGVGFFSIPKPFVNFGAKALGGIVQKATGGKVKSSWVQKGIGLMDAASRGDLGAMAKTLKLRKRLNQARRHGFTALLPHYQAMRAAGKGLSRIHRAYRKRMRKKYVRLCRQGRLSPRRARSMMRRRRYA